MNWSRVKDTNLMNNDLHEQNESKFQGVSPAERWLRSRWMKSTGVFSLTYEIVEETERGKVNEFEQMTK